jgi:transposase
MDMAYRITEEEYEEIKAAEKKTKDKRQSRQLKVLMLRYEGKSNPEISEKLDISTDRISHLISEFKRKGLGEYIKNKYKGNNRNMTYEEEEGILKRFSAAEEAGQIITVKEIKAAFDEKLGKDTGRGYIYMLLARHGWRKIKPRPKHPKKASEEEIAASKKLNPNWKKSS